jgi:hypothetical protein
LKHIWWFSSTFHHVEAILTLFKRRRKTPANLTVRSHNSKWGPRSQANVN